MKALVLQMVSTEQMQNAIQSIMHLSTENLNGESKSRYFTYGRMIFAKNAMNKGLKLVKIANILHRTHSSVTYYVKQFDIDIMYNPEFRSYVNGINEYNRKGQN